VGTKVAEAPPTHCLRCGLLLRKHPHAGRPRKYCDVKCYRKALWARAKGSR
jgi:hypothetical protein